MAEQMEFELVTPEMRLVARQVESVDIPGVEGDMTVMPKHAPLVTTLKPGRIRIHDGGSSEEFLVTGGFVEITAAGTSVLAESVLTAENITRAAVDSLIQEAEEAALQSQGAAKDLAQKRVGNYRAILNSL